MSQEPVSKEQTALWPIVKAGRHATYLCGTKHDIAVKLTRRWRKSAHDDRMRFHPVAVLLVAVFTVGGCASTPPGADVPRTHTTALANPLETRLGRSLDARAKTHPGESGFKLLPVGMDGYLVRTELAAAAEKTLDVQYYIVQNDDTGQLIIDSLLRAADRGVRVRLLIDDTGTVGREMPITSLAAHPNIELRLFNPFVTGGTALGRAAEFVLGASRLDYRMHNKLYVADNAVAVIGGRNI